LSDGNIEFLGRIDRQVKISGYRIELAEIETRLTSLATIKEAVVIDETRKSGDKFLAAYVVGNDSFDAGDIKNYLADQLPDYMIPTHIIKVEQIPWTSIGKVDRKRLPNVQAADDSQQTFIAPDNETEKRLSEIWQNILEKNCVSVEDNFFDLGGTSLDIMKLNNAIKEEFNKQIPIVSLFEYTTIRALAQLIAEKEPEKQEETEIINTIEKEQDKFKEQIQPDNGRISNEIAVIGMAGIFPGGRNLQDFWENLKNGVETIHFFSTEELLEDGADKEIIERPNYIRAKGIIEGAYYFDASFFGATPMEAQIMDPQMRIFQQTVWHALEDAGYNPYSYNQRIGLFAGASPNYYWTGLALYSGINRTVSSFMAALLADKDFICTFTSYKLNLKGPSISVQTACSTSLVAIHNAVQALMLGECEMALAGGISISYPHKRGYIYEAGMILSSDGHNRAFDARGDGTLFGDGVGVVVLKPLANAAADRDHIYAVIKGSAINNDGFRKVGYTAPSIQGQVEVIQAAQAVAKVEPESISYIEAHGTATRLGDIVEIEALTQAFHSDKKRFCAVGTVKSNMGHLYSAAGAAGFIKTVLALYHRLIPPSLHFQNPNPQIDFQNSPFYVNATLKEWRNDQYPLRAGVSSFGIGGTNAHIILEEYTQPGILPSMKEISHYLLPLSAKTQSALEKVTENFAAFLKTNNGMNLADAAYTLSVGREAFEYKKTIVCTDLNDAINALESASPDKIQAFRTKEKDRPVVFMFPGQGAQYVNMGLGLYNQEPVFRQEMDQCFEILKSQANFDLKDILYPTIESSEQGDINRTEITQPAIFCFEYSLAKLLMSWGIKPYAMTGHSIGEYAAACLSGVFSLADALKLTVLRGRLMQGMPPGAMLSVPLPEDELKSLLIPGISLAAANSTSLCVVSGPYETIEKFETRLQDMGRPVRRLHTSHAFHSAMMEPILAEFEESVKKTPLSNPTIPFISNLTGQWIANEKATSPGYWARHLREAVNFRDGLSRLLENKNALFVEVGPGNVLSAFLRQHKDKKPDHFVINMIRHPNENIPDDFFLTTKIGQLWLYGVNIDWTGYYSREERYRVALPNYPFEGQRFYLSPDRGFGGAKIGEWSGAPALKKNGDELEEPEKVNEKRAPIMYSRPELTRSYVAPRSESERKMVDLWQYFFGIQPVGIDDDFFELGGDSLKAITISADIHREFRVKIALPELFEHSTIRALSEYIDAAEKTTFVGIEAVEKKEYYSLSAGQKRLYILNRLEVMSTAYNMSELLSLEGTLDIPKLDESFKNLLFRHESLRTSFEVINEEPVQRIHNEVEFEIEYFAADAGGEHGQTRTLTKVLGGQGTLFQKGSLPPEAFIKSFIRPFNLSRAPLMRVGLLQEAENKYLLAIDIHHIIADGRSQVILVRDFLSFYFGQELPALKLQYKEYSEWKESPEAQDSLKVQEDYWLKEFAEQIPALNLPIDFPRPAVQSFEGDTVSFELNAGETGRLNEIAHMDGATLFMALLAIYNIFLAKLSNLEDIVVGTAVAGRRHADLENLVGMFVNTLALRNFPLGEKPFTVFLNEIKEKTLKAFDNQDYPFEELVEKAAVERDLGRNPIFDAMFVFQNIFDDPGQGAKPGEETGGFKFKRYNCEQKTSIFDLSLIVFEKGEGLWLSFEYCTKLFRPETVLRFIEYFKKIVSAVIEAPGKSIGDIEIITEEEKLRILNEFNDTAVEYFAEKSVHQLFEEQALKGPDRVGLVGEVGQVGQVGLVGLTYRQLQEQSDRLAGVLIEKGVLADSVVGLMIERSVKMIIGLLGILKSGGAYLPIDPEYPEERIDYMLKDSNAKLLAVANDKEGEKVRRWAGEIVLLENIVKSPKNSSYPLTFLPSYLPNSRNLAYIIYTSGSTGKPKGVAIGHRNAVNFFKGMTDRIDFSPHRIVLAVTTISFDIFLLETLLPLTRGLRIVIANENQQRDPGALWKLIGNHEIDLLQMTPSRLKLLLSQSDHGYLDKIGDILVGGEAFPIELFEELKKKFQGNIINVYGPTETTVWSTLKNLTGQMEINIGKPIANTLVFILDKFNRPQPIGVAGELCIGGDGVARGYLNRPELTAERFIKYRSYRTNRTYIIYKTGDLARWLPDGNILFLGRIDHQVKIRGFRVELEEISRRLLDCRDVDDAVVIDRENSAGEKYLCAYLASTKELDIPGIKRMLAETLPGYMIPSHFIQLEKIPLTGSGKIDRRTLLSFKTQAKTEVELVLPRNEIEKKIAQAWKEILELEKVGVNENFFDLGGTSMDIIRLNAKFTEIFHEEETIVQMFRYPTIRTFAEYLTRERGAVAAESKVISPDQVNRIKQSRQTQKNKRRSLK
jgi:amino acid adenylation domain-containing protein